MSAIDELSMRFRRGPTFKYESHIVFGGPYDWHEIDGRLTLRKRPPWVKETT